MREMFQGCTGLQELDLTSFNTGRVTTLANIFRDINHNIKVKIVADNCEKLILESEKYDYVELVYT